jgi:hypothetical protein
MSDVHETPEAAEPSAKDEKPVKKPKTTKAAAASPPGKKQAKAKDETVVGRVSRVTVRAVPGEKVAAIVELRLKKDGHLSVALDGANSAALPAMLALAGAALASGEKLHVRTAMIADGSRVAVDMELRLKR